MCGRFALIDTVEEIKSQFSVENEFELKPDFNIFPTHEVVCVVEPEPHHRQCVFYRWGLIPSWTTERTKLRNWTNARCETVFQTAVFSKPVQSRRCLMLMSGFFEWQQNASGKQPYYIHKANHELLAVAAFWEAWQGEDKMIYSCCLVTCEASSLMKPIHHRMPVLLNTEQQKIWLNNTRFSQDELMAMMRPHEDDELIAYPVTPLVNRPQFNNPLAIEPYFERS